MNLQNRWLSAFSQTRKLLIGLSVIAVIMIGFVFVTAQAQDAPTGTETTQLTANTKYGRISGVIVDAKTGEKLTGVTVLLAPPNEALDAHIEVTKAAMLGAKTNMDGEYLVRSVPPGIYTVTITMIGYAKTVISDFKVSSDDVAKLDVSLKTEDVRLKDDIKVTAKRDKGTTSANDVIRKTASGAMDIVSAEQIGRSGAGDAQSALSKVTGVSLMGDQAFVRGVSDRYLSIQMNGSTMPSSDPDKQSFRTDIVASNLLDNIVVQKTYTPDQPGNFTGAAINLATKSYPETRTLIFSGGIANNDLATGNENFITSAGSSSDKWGYDNGFRDMPKFVKDNIMNLPGQVPYYDSEKAHLAEDVLKSLNNDIEPTTKKAPFNRNFGLSYGDNLLLFGRNIGLVGALSYDHHYSFYDDGISQRYDADQSTQSNSATISFGGAEIEAKDEVAWSALSTLSYSPAANQDFSFTYVRNQEGVSEAQEMRAFDNVSSVTRPSFFYIRTLGYTERSLESFQLKGAHRLMSAGKNGVRLDWQLSNSTATQDEPDRRSFYDYNQVADNGNTDSLGNPIIDTTTVPQNSGSSAHSTRLWRYLDENNKEAKADLTIPVSQSTKFKTGFDYLNKDRNNDEFILQLMNDASYTNKFGQYYYYEGDWEKYLNEAGGISDSSTTRNDRFMLGPVYTNAPDWKVNNSDANQKITSWYGMFEFLPISKLKVIAGTRFEKTDMTVSAKYDGTLISPIGVGQTLTFNSGDEIGSLHTSDWLPSVNLVYSLASTMNLRAAYSRTLARPNLREFSPAKTYDYVRAQPYIGNPNLERTLINNFDLRWEWFTKPGEVLAVSGFYKRFTNPIEIGFVPNGSDEARVPMNVESGKLYGAEFEIRKNLGILAKPLQSFFLGTNVTISHSREDLSPLEKSYYESYNLEPSRPLQGQPSYVVNTDLTYINTKWGTRASLLYNVVGDQLFINTDGITPDVYEKHRPMLDLTFSQTIWAGFSLKCAAKNILDEKLIRYYKVRNGIDVEETPGVTKKDGTAYYERYSLGQTFSASLSWQVW